MRLMCLANGRRAFNALRRLSFHGAVAVLFLFVVTQGALSAHAATHENSAIDQCSICHAAGSEATPAQAAAIIFTVNYSRYVPRLSLARDIPSFNIPSYLAARSPPTSL